MLGFPAIDADTTASEERMQIKEGQLSQRQMRGFQSWVCFNALGFLLHQHAYGVFALSPPYFKCFQLVRVYTGRLKNPD